MSVKIGTKTIGAGHPCYIIAEIGINANGSIDLAKAMIDVAADAGCDAVKFQKRTVEQVYSKEDLARPRKSPFGETNGDLKRGLEFSVQQYEELGKYAIAKDLAWGASCWDQFAVTDLVVRCSVKPSFLKIASPTLTDPAVRLAMQVAQTRDKIPIILSTGMSTWEEIREAVAGLDADNLILMHCVSAYPAPVENLNLRMMTGLWQEFSVPVGYSGHEEGIALSHVAVAMGADCLERHFTLDRGMWGSDQKISLTGDNFRQLIGAIRATELAKGVPKKVIHPCEKPAMTKLRRV